MFEKPARKPNPTDSWLAPEHARMGQGMRRYRNGQRGEDGMFVHCPGERVLPEPECLKQQREAAECRELAEFLGLKFVSRDIYLEYYSQARRKKRLLTGT